MNESRFTLFAACLLLLAAPLLPVTAAVAQSGQGAMHLKALHLDAAGYDLSWWTVDGGGTTGGSQTHPYSLGGTVGQPDAAVWSGGSYTLAGGFWGGVGIEFRVYLPLMLRGA